ncbi:MAG: asparaginase [Beijerinckiaceae bacterium]|nr:asparaginase [Beijerinckiaceae bacterium]
MSARVCLVVCPGTLPSQGMHRFDITHYNVRSSGKERLTAQQMLDQLPELAGFADVEPDGNDPFPVATHANLAHFARHMQGVVDRADVDGAVVVQGTNTLEETAFFLNLVLKTAKPVVVVGSQRPFTSVSTDAHLNLANAIRVAACEEARGKGVLVVTNSEINAGRDVTKTFTFQVQTFRSRDLGVLGYADADRIVFYRTPTRLHTQSSEFTLADADNLPKVEVLYGHTGADPRLARAAVELGAKGLVMAGIGAGAMGLYLDTLVALAAEGVRVVRSARVGEGRVIAVGNTHEEGTIAADNLNPQKAAILLAFAMARGKDNAAIQAIFDTY